MPEVQQLHLSQVRHQPSMLFLGSLTPLQLPPTWNSSLLQDLIINTNLGSRLRVLCTVAVLGREGCHRGDAVVAVLSRVPLRELTLGEQRSLPAKSHPKLCSSQGCATLQAGK